MTPCPLNGCNLCLTRTIFRKCITERKYQLIFAKSLVRNFIARNNNIKPCPNPKCNLSIRVPVSILKEIKKNDNTLSFLDSMIFVEKSNAKIMKNVIISVS